MDPGRDGRHGRQVDEVCVRAWRPGAGHPEVSGWAGGRGPAAAGPGVAARASVPGPAMEFPADRRAPGQHRQDGAANPSRPRHRRSAAADRRPTGHPTSTRGGPPCTATRRSPRCWAATGSRRRHRRGGTDPAGSGGGDGGVSDQPTKTQWAVSWPPMGSFSWPPTNQFFAGEESVRQDLLMARRGVQYQAEVRDEAGPAVPRSVPRWWRGPDPDPAVITRLYVQDGRTETEI